ncbi:hypothetical protein [Granulicella sp. L46]|jgi:hypothetical protein|uniref:hypothetical protein n=1 Tax=Granulicella sp. L46 TaxID=1641865 RepID=UPI00131E60BD|nr:hypothetical protein [Granulicella sp. L46]
MKLANITAKVRGMKFNAVKVLAAATLAGGLLVAAAPAAQAQRVVVGFRGPRVFYGGPRVVVAPPVVAYGAPYYAGPVYGPTVGVGFYGRGGWDRDRRFDHDRGGWGRGRR